MVQLPGPNPVTRPASVVVDRGTVPVLSSASDERINFSAQRSVNLNRSTYYLPPAAESAENLRLMRKIDEQYLKTPFYGSRRMTAVLERAGESVNRERVQRFMRLMGLEGIFPG